jgi:hypothetical protein
VKLPGYISYREDVEYVMMNVRGWGLQTGIGREMLSAAKYDNAGVSMTTYKE